MRLSTSQKGFVPLPRIVAGILSVGLTVLGANAASGQDYPNKPIRIVTAGLGGGSDIEARMVAQWLTSAWGQQVIVDNRPATFILGQIVSRAPPDGYTLVVAGSGLWIQALLRSDVPYDPVKDFAPITMLETAPNILVVVPSVPANSVKELIAVAKARPASLNYASTGTGSSTHLAAELFKAAAGVNIVHVPYKSMGAALTDLLGGQMQLMFTTSAGLPHVRSGKLRGLAVTSARPSALFPGLPAVAETVPGYEAESGTAALAPAQTPARIVRRLNQEIVRFLNLPDTQARFLGMGVTIVANSPEQLAATIKSDMTKMGKIIKDAGIRAD